MMRGAILGRYMRQGGPTIGAQTVSRRKRQKDTEPFVCVPCLWPTTVGLVMGSMLTLIGVAMCSVGFYSEELSETVVFNGTHNVTEINYGRESALSKLTFVGPVVMGTGAFIVVVACVVMFETRDKLVITIKQHWHTETCKKPDFYDTLVMNMKRKAQGQVNDGFEPDAKSRGFGLFNFRRSISSTKSGASNRSVIEEALRTIPVSLFSVDMERRRRHTLEPIKTQRRPSLEAVMKGRSLDIPPTRLRSPSSPTLIPYDSLSGMRAPNVHKKSSIAPEQTAREVQQVSESVITCTAAVCPVERHCPDDYSSKPLKHSERLLQLENIPCSPEEPDSDTVLLSHSTDDDVISIAPVQSNTILIVDCHDVASLTEIGNCAKDTSIDTATVYDNVLSEEHLFNTNDLYKLEFTDSQESDLKECNDISDNLQCITADVHNQADTDSYIDFRDSVNPSDVERVSLDRECAYIATASKPDEYQSVQKIIDRPTNILGIGTYTYDNDSDTNDSDKDIDVSKKECEKIVGSLISPRETTSTLI